mgnify:FL=1
MGPITLKNTVQKNFDLGIYLGVTHVIVLSVGTSGATVSPSSSSICSRIDLSVVALTPRSTPEYITLAVDFCATPIPTPIELNIVACVQAEELKHKIINANIRIIITVLIVL